MQIIELNNKSSTHGFLKQTLFNNGVENYLISTGGMIKMPDSEAGEIGYNRFYETIIFSCDSQGKAETEVHLEGMPDKWCISEPHQDAEAEEMHSSFVEFLKGYLSGS